MIVLFSQICKRQGKEALFVWIALQSILANFFVLKQITLFGLNATASDMFAVGGLLGLNLIQAYYGKEAAKKAVGISFIAMTFFCILSQAHIYYVPNHFDTSHDAYAQLLTPAPRILIGSLIAFLVVQSFDVFLFDKLKRHFPKNSFTKISIICLFTSQALDTILFAHLALYGIVNKLWEVILIGYLIKTFTILFMVPLFHISGRSLSTK